MKSACIILSVLVFIAILAVCVMVKFATDITAEEKKRDYLSGSSVYQLSKSMGIVHLNENKNFNFAGTFPFVAAIIKNDSQSFSFSCFGSVILLKWIVTSAHCRQHGATHRVLLYYDFTRNHSHTYPMLFWRVHEKFNASNPNPKFDLAVAKLNIDYYPFVMKPAVFDKQESIHYVDASVWKTLSTMDKRIYLTNDFDKFPMKIVHKQRCFESYGIDLDDSLICIDMSDYEDCFIQEFGPIFWKDKIVGILTVKPRDCDTKLAVFTNVSYYTDWILKTTHTAFYG